MDYTDGSTLASVSWEDIFGNDESSAGTYNDGTRELDLSAGSSSYDGLWQVRDDIPLVYDENTFILNGELDVIYDNKKEGCAG